MGTNSIEGTGTYIVSLGQHVGLRTPVLTAAAAAAFMLWPCHESGVKQSLSVTTFMRHGCPSAVCFPSAAYAI